MALVGVTSYEPAWVTRVDVAVDAECRPEDGKLLLDALEACRLPNGWRVRSVGVPRPTVYFIARVKDDAKARAYCRNLKTRQGAPFGRIRLEAQARYGPLDVMLDDVQDPSFCASVWHSRYGGLEGTVTRLARELQATELAGRVGRGEMTYAQGERMSTFLDLERLGLAETYYPRSVHMARKREARALGLASNEMGLRGIEVDVEYLLAPYRKAFGGTQLAGDAALALASGTPPPGVASEVAERLPGI